MLRELILSIRCVFEGCQVSCEKDNGRCHSWWLLTMGKMTIVPITVRKMTKIPMKMKDERGEGQQVQFAMNFIWVLIAGR